MRQVCERTTSRTGQRAFAWAALTALALLLASGLQVMATKALVEPVPSSSTVDVSPVTAALADGDEVHARFLASLRAHGLGAWNASPPADDRSLVTELTSSSTNTQVWFVSVDAQRMLIALDCGENGPRTDALEIYPEELPGVMADICGV